MAEKKASREYELLVRDLIARLPIYADVTTTKLVHDTRLKGHATDNQIDVLWDFTDAAGQDHRVIFEARSYARTIEQGKLHAFRSVVDDLQDPSRPVVGAMVTTQGYQRGAKQIAETYGVLVLELRQPTAGDMKDRLAQIDLTVVPQFVAITDVKFEAVDVYDPSATGTTRAVEHMTVVAHGDDACSERALRDVLTAGELGELGKPRAPHVVQRTFDPPVELWVDGSRTALIRGIVATVGETQGRPATATVGGIENIAYLLRDALTDARVWFAKGGRVWEME